MKIDFYQIDTFTDELFKGNGAGVCPLDQWLPDRLMRNIASENNLSETAFFVKEGEQFHIRWFTPASEVDLCGHATLASAYVLYEYLNYGDDAVSFTSRSGELTVRNQEELLQMDFPCHTIESSEIPEGMVEGLGIYPKEVLRNGDYIAVLEDEDEILAINPDFNILSKISTRGICITAPGNDADFVSRFFAPRIGINEDPVTGSTHCGLVPYWAGRLGKSELKAAQLSERGGKLLCELRNERVLISGKAQTYLTGKIHLPAMD